MNIILSALDIPYRVRQRNRKWEVFNTENKNEIKAFKNGMIIPIK